MSGAMPVKASERYAILDILRGFALLGIILANFPEFSLYTFLSSEAAASMPSAGADRAVRWLQGIFVDGKFYTIFSLLFGVGFSIILSNAQKRGADGYMIFYRRMLMLLVIGFLHLMFIWSGDILMLYALMGMLLPLFSRLSDRAILRCAGVLLLVPVAVDTLTDALGVSLSAPVVRTQQDYCARYGINDENFAYWLRDAKSYKEVLEFLVQGAFVRMQEFIDGNRYFKVLGLFLIGFWAGRRRLYADLATYRPQLRKIALIGLCVGLPFSALYTWSGLAGHPYGLGLHAALYCLGVYPLGFAYVALLSLLHLRLPGLRVFRVLAAPGRMALTNYIFQSVFGTLIFYGIGFGLGASMGLSLVALVAFGIYLIQAAFSSFWIARFNFGPLEWIWRMLTYGKIFPLVRRG